MMYFEMLKKVAKGKSPSNFLKVFKVLMGFCGAYRVCKGCNIPFSTRSVSFNDHKCGT